MPHTSRPNSKSNKSKAKKRLQVTDSTGWTHVTTTNLSRAVPKAKASDENEDEVDLPPAEPPTNLTLSALETQFARHHERFLASDCWRTISNTVCRALTQTQLDHLVVVSLALGSPSGFLRGGWVDRRAVSMDQVVALVCIRDVLRTSPPPGPYLHCVSNKRTGQRGNVTVYTQDPVYNNLDKELFSKLDIKVVEHPRAFDLVSQSSLVYCPGAERAHLGGILEVMPWGLLGGPLEDMEGADAQRFVQDRTATRIPVYEPNETAFWGMRVYF